MGTRGGYTPESLYPSKSPCAQSSCSGQSEPHAAQRPLLLARLIQGGGEAPTGCLLTKIPGLARAESEFRSPPQPLSTSAPSFAQLSIANHNFKTAIVIIIK